VKVIKKNLSFKDARNLADSLALATDKVHSVKRERTTKPTFSVHEGMVGTLLANSYTARPETLKWNRSK
jgi:hypothetical protein